MTRLDVAFKRAKDIESLYRDTATVYTYSNTKSTGFDDDKKQMEMVVENVPAKLSKSGLKSASKETFAGVAYDAMLYLDTSVKIPAGAIIEVTNVNGLTTTYRRASGGYMGYATHQEVAVVYEERK
ncbi:hypothetical protein [Weissella tructae]